MQKVLIVALAVMLPKLGYAADDCEKLALTYNRIWQQSTGSEIIKEIMAVAEYTIDEELFVLNMNKKMRLCEKAPHILGSTAHKKAIKDLSDKMGDYSAYLSTLKLAQKGEARSQFLLCLANINGSFFDKRRMIEPNKPLGYEWCVKSALQDSSFAQGKTAELLYFGSGTDRNYIESYAWALLARSHGQGVVGFNRNKQLLDELDEVMSPEDVSKAYKRSHEILGEIKTKKLSSK